MMRLLNLHIELTPTWHEVPNAYVGQITYEGQAGEIKYNLTPEIVSRMFPIIAAGLLEASEEAARSLTSAVFDSQALLGVQES